MGEICFDTTKINLRVSVDKLYGTHFSIRYEVDQFETRAMERSADRDPIPLHSPVNSNSRSYSLSSLKSNEEKNVKKYDLLLLIHIPPGCYIDPLELISRSRRKGGIGMRSNRGKNRMWSWISDYTLIHTVRGSVYPEYIHSPSSPSSSFLGDGYWLGIEWLGVHAERRGTQREKEEEKCEWNESEDEERERERERERKREREREREGWRGRRIDMKGFM